MKKVEIQIDYPSTKREVEHYMKVYKYYLCSVIEKPPIFENNMINISYINVNDKHIKDKEKYNQKKEYVEWITNSINKLNELYRIILINTYFQKQNDDILANKIGYTIYYYYTIKKQTIINFAYSLSIEKTYINI